MKVVDIVKKYKFLVCFFFILALKFLLAGFFSSDYQDKLFMPFVQGWLLNGGNPYDYFSGRQMFPYPPLMLFIESIGGMLSLGFAENRFLSTAFFKVPLFVFDILCFVFLANLFPKKKKQITAIYFCSPILLYSTYMHGQLDIMPTALLVGSIFFLLSKKKNRYLFSSLLISAALCTKFHILAFIPLFFIFIAKRNGIKDAFLYGALIPAAACILFVAPFWCGGFLQDVLFNKEQSVLTKIHFDFDSLKIYIPILAIILIYLRMLVVARINRDLFFGFCAILFSVFLILVPPMPGWYMWVLPFLVIFYIDIRSDRKINFLIFTLLNVMYALFFIFARDTPLIDLSFLGKSLDSLKIQSQSFCNILFTTLFAVHAYVIYYIYCKALSGNSFYKKQNEPFIVGISGDSGSGKSTLVGIFKNMFGAQRILALECDGDHKWTREDSNWKSYTHLNPIANFLYRQAKDISMLKAGKSVFRSEYNHSTGKFDPPKKILPKPYVLVTGLHALYLPQLRQQEDLKIYMDIDENLRRFWKIQRDVHQRGHSLEDTLVQIESRMPDFHKYIEPQKDNADLLISYFDKNLTDCSLTEYSPNLSLKITAVNSVNFEPLVDELSKYGIMAQYEFNGETPYQTLVFESENFEQKTIPAMELAYAVVPEIDLLLRQPIETKNNMWTVIGMVILIMINEFMV